MPYDYSCDARLVDDCDRHGDVPAMAGQFREPTWMGEDFGGRMQDLGFNLHDTITICPACMLEIAQSTGRFEDQ